MADATFHESAETRREGIGLCLSGGGYRAMLFHAGALWRINEAGLLRKLSFVSSVSGGSITAGLLGHAWHHLDFDEGDTARNFRPEVVGPLRSLARKNIDRDAIIQGVLLPGRSVADRVTAAYRERLFDTATLQDLPERPRFIITAGNLQNGALWRFSRPYMGDWILGLIKDPGTELATAVAASSAFPPFLSPVRLPVMSSQWSDGSGSESERPDHVVLSDGGVYDNLGLEPVIKRCRAILVSDGGGRMRPQRNVPGDWPRHLLRVLSVVDNQVRALRKRHLISAYQDGEFQGAYWGIRSDIAEYGIPDALPAPSSLTTQLAEIRTRLCALPPATQERLINWGYAVCDAGLRRWFDNTLAPPAGFPYPQTGLVP